MGEAKRRKQAGAYPDGGPVQHFRVPHGKLGMTVAVRDEDPSTLLFDADKVADIMAGLERQARPPYYTMVRGLADEFVRTKRRGGDLAGIGLGILWTALYHPKMGSETRAAVSRDLREKGTAHITWRLSEAGLSIALADQFVDLDPLMAAAPKDGLTSAWRAHDDDPKPN